MVFYASSVRFEKLFCECKLFETKINQSLDIYNYTALRYWGIHLKSPIQRKKMIFFTLSCNNGATIAVEMFFGTIFSNVKFFFASPAIKSMVLS